MIATYNGLGVLRILHLLGWTRSRLDAALTTIAEHLAPTALRVVATDERLTLMLRPDVIPAVIRAQFEHEYRVDYPLDPGTAVAVLELVREKILEPFPERDEQRPYTRPKSFNAAYLVGARWPCPSRRPRTARTPPRSRSTPMSCSPSAWPTPRRPRASDRVWWPHPEKRVMLGAWALCTSCARPGRWSGGRRLTWESDY